MWGVVADRVGRRDLIGFMLIAVGVIVAIQGIFPTKGVFLAESLIDGVVDVRPLQSRPTSLSARLSMRGVVFASLMSANVCVISLCSGGGAAPDHADRRC